MFIISQNISKFTEYEQWYALLDHKKRQRVDSLSNTAVRKQIVISDMLARKAVAKMLDVSLDSIIFEKNEKGKPFVKDLPVHFSVSHSGDWVICAASKGEIGVDIEQIRPIDIKTVRKVCSVEECEYILTVIILHLILPYIFIKINRFTERKKWQYFF